MLILAACSPNLTAQPADELAEEIAPTATATSVPTLQNTEPGPTRMPFQLIRSGFQEGEVIPAQFACTGENLSPEFTWGQPPPDTVTLALIFDDPDALGGSWVHWILFNIPPDAGSLPAAISPLAQYPDGSLSGINSWGELGYGGPCPPQGSTHQYLFALYALDTALDLESSATKQDLLIAMQSHILAETQLTGLFSR